ncbi:MAG: hypothetical protein ACFCGT_08155 [Sandaracinaceae bacterium]
MDEMGPTQHGGSGVNLHDPVLQSTPRLRSLKRQVPIALGVFLVGMLASMALLFVAMESEPRWVIGLVTSATLFVSSTAYFAYVTTALSLGAKRARRRQAEEVLGQVARWTREAGRGSERRGDEGP